jgi:hypothetical protein
MLFYETCATYMLITLTSRLMLTAKCVEAICQFLLHVQPSWSVTVSWICLPVHYLSSFRLRQTREMSIVRYKYTILTTNWSLALDAPCQLAPFLVPGNAIYGSRNDPFRFRQKMDVCDVAKMDTTCKAMVASMSGRMEQLLSGPTYICEIPGSNSERGSIPYLTLSIVFLSHCSQMSK